MSNAYIHTLLGHHAKTQRILTSLTLNAGGWDALLVDPTLAKAPSVFLYVMDAPTGWTWVCAVPCEAFSRVARDFRSNPDYWNDVRGSLALALHSAAGGQPLPTVNGMDWQQQLGFLLSAYAGTTQVLQLAGGLATGGHFITLNYRKSTADREGKLRPFVVPGESNHVLPVDFFSTQVETVNNLDRKNHPEWFS